MPHSGHTLPPARCPLSLESWAQSVTSHRRAHLLPPSDCEPQRGVGGACLRQASPLGPQRLGMAGVPG